MANLSFYAQEIDDILGRADKATAATALTSTDTLAGLGDGLYTATAEVASAISDSPVSVAFTLRVLADMYILILADGSDTYTGAPGSWHESSSGEDTTARAAIAEHIADKSNPHEVTKAQVGLGNVDNVATKEVLAELVDAGAKNKFDIDNLSIGGTYNATHSIADNTLSVVSTGSYGRLSTAHTLPTGKYVFSCKVLNVNILGGASAIRITLNSSGSNPIAKQVYTAATDIVMPFELTEDSTVYIMFYTNESSTSYTNSADFADIILCTKAAWDTSQKFVPYRPSYDELVARIEALESGGN